MRKVMKKSAVVTGLIAIVFFAGCASTPEGNARAQKTVLDVKMPAPGKSKVVFVRPDWEGMWHYTFTVHDGERLIGNATEASFFEYECDPGDRLFSTSMENIAFLEANLLPDRIYYVKVLPAMGWATPKIHLVSLHP